MRMNSNHTPAKCSKSVSVDSRHASLACAVAAIHISFCPIDTAGRGGATPPGDCTACPCVHALIRAYESKMVGWLMSTVGIALRTSSRCVRLCFPQPFFSARARISPRQTTEVNAIVLLSPRPCVSRASIAQCVSRMNPSSMLVSNRNLDMANRSIELLQQIFNGFVTGPCPSKADRVERSGLTPKSGKEILCSGTRQTR